MTALTPTFALFDGPALLDRQGGEPVLRYRGVAYRPTAAAPAPEPAPGQRRYRGVAY